MNNLRQIGVAVSLYTGDYGAYPVDYSRIPGWSPTLGWQDKLEPYGIKRPPESYLPLPIKAPYASGSRTVLSCPSFLKAHGTLYEESAAYGYNKGGLAHQADDLSAQHAQLGLAGELLVGPTGYAQDIPVRPIRDSEIRNPSQMIAVGDSILIPTVYGLKGPGILLGMADLSEGIVHAVPNLQLYTSLGKRRHKGKMNLIYCDGHIERFKTERILDSKSPEIRALWNNDNQPHMELQ